MARPARLFDAPKGYQKVHSDPCTVGEAIGIANAQVTPALVSARFALWIAFLSMIVAAVAVAIAIVK